MRLLFLIMFLSSSLYAQKVLQIKKKRVIITKEDLDLDKGSVYYFSNGKSKIKAKVLKVAKTKVLLGVYKGKLRKGDTLELISAAGKSSSSKRSSKKSRVSMNHKPHRFSIGGAYMLVGEWTEEEVGGVSNNQVDAFSVPGVQASYEFHLKNKLSFGLGVKYSLSTDVFSKDGSFASQTGSTQSDSKGSILQIIPTIGYNVIDNLRVSLGYGLTELKLVRTLTSEEEKIQLRGLGLHAGIDYDYYFNPKFGIRGSLSYDMATFTAPTDEAGDPAANIEQDSSSSIIGIGIGAIMKF